MIEQLSDVHLLFESFLSLGTQFILQGLVGDLLNREFVIVTLLYTFLFLKHFQMAELALSKVDSGESKPQFLVPKARCRTLARCSVCFAIAIIVISTFIIYNSLLNILKNLMENPIGNCDFPRASIAA